MITRNERNAIIQHGTMTLVRRSLLERLGGWSEWCITEDAELGLRVFEAGYQATYLPQSYGRGLMPDTFIDFKKQRYRWAYGAMQIMKHHFGPIVLGTTKLTRAQRYQFLAGWLPWISDGLAVIVTFFALFWTALMTIWPKYFDVPMEALSATALVLFLVKTLKTVILYPPKVGSGLKGAIQASIAGLALTHTVGKAVIMGILTSKMPFLRTPKLEGRSSLDQVVRVAWQEITLFSLCVVALIATATARGAYDPAAILWMVMLMVQALPYAATIVTATLSAFALQGAEKPVLKPVTPAAPEKKAA
jgi:hypothetical protein